MVGAVPRGENTVIDDDGAIGSDGEGGYYEDRQGEREDDPDNGSDSEDDDRLSENGSTNESEGSEDPYGNPEPGDDEDYGGGSRELRRVGPGSVTRSRSMLNGQSGYVSI